MPDSKRKVQQQHLEHPDDGVERSPESGDPQETRRSHGKPVDENGAPIDAREPGKDEHWESGRQQAT